MTGFRVALGGAQALYNVKPDLTTLGKVIGGGMPVGAVGGRQDIMACLAPEGAVYQAGTLSGNPLAMAAGLATLAQIEVPEFFEQLSAHAGILMGALIQIARDLNVPFVANHAGGMFGFFFTEHGLPKNYQDVMLSNEIFFKQFYHGMLKEGVYFAPSCFEAGFISSAHQQAELAKTAAAFERVLSRMTIQQ
jgi:glutamate-1-semialdehyde 2,1-aminomutase